MENVVKFPSLPCTQTLTWGAFLRAVMPLVLLDGTLLPANLRALLKAWPLLWGFPGLSSAVECLLWEQEVAGSIPAVPTFA